VAELEDVRRVLSEIPRGTEGITIELRSGDGFQGEFLGFDGSVARLRTARGDEHLPLADIAGVQFDAWSKGPE
jgi:hypothetical protein